MGLTLNPGPQQALFQSHHLKQLIAGTVLCASHVIGFPLISDLGLHFQFGLSQFSE